MIGYIQNLKKYFYAFFIKKSCIILILQPKNEGKYFEHSISYFKLHLQGVYFRFTITICRSEPCRGQFSIFEKKVQFFPLEGKKLTRLHFVQKEAQIVEYGPTVVSIV